MLNVENVTIYKVGNGYRMTLNCGECYTQSGNYYRLIHATQTYNSNRTCRTNKLMRSRVATQRTVCVCPLSALVAVDPKDHTCCNGGGGFPYVTDDAYCVAFVTFSITLILIPTRSLDCAGTTQCLMAVTLVLNFVMGFLFT